MIKLNNTPNASKTLSSLRFLDYTTETAITDLIDNSADAKASSVHIWIIQNEKGKIIQIDIADDGEGMDKDVLIQAMKLGSNTDKNENYELGKFGMGLITASISQGRRLEVFSVSHNFNRIDNNINNNKFVKAVQDLDDIEESNEFEVYISEHSIDENANYCSLMKGKNQDKLNKGTVVSIQKIDKTSWTRADKLADKLKKVIGQTYRKFIQNDVLEFFVHVTDKKDLNERLKLKMDFDKDRVKAVDPINDHEPELLNEADIKTESGSMKLRVYSLKNKGHEINRENHINIPGQGFYLLRNSREIISGASFGLFTKHNDLNCLRCELEITGESDSLAGINFSKQNASLNKSLEQKINAEFQPYLKQVRQEARKRQQSKNDSNTDFSEVEKQITKKSHLLSPIKTEIEERFQKVDRDKIIENERKKINKHGPRLNLTKKKRVSIDAMNVKFNQISLGHKGPLYKGDMEKGTVIVQWNEDHPFYTNVISPNNTNPDIFNPLAYLVYCNAKAELIASGDTEDILENIRYAVGKDLATLISN